MNKTTVIKNYFYNLLYQLLAIIVPIITTPYVSRVLHADGIGIYSYTHTIANFFVLFAILGTNTYGQREIAYVKNDRFYRSKVFGEILICRLSTSIIVLVGYFFVCVYYKKYTYYLLLQCFSILGAMIDTAWFFQGLENFKITAEKNIFIKVLSVILMFLVVKSEYDIDKYILINSLSIVLSNSLLFLSVKKSIIRIPFTQIQIKRHIKGIIEFFLPTIAVHIYSHVDKIMLGALTSNIVESGYYEQTRKMTNLIIMVLVSLNTVLFSRISALFSGKNKEQIIKAYKKSFRLNLFVMCPIVIGIYICADNFVLWFFGRDYEKVAGLIRLSCPLIVFMCIGNFVGVQYLNAMGKQNKATMIYMFSAIINIILNAILIPRYLSIGALIASIIAEGLACFSQVYLIKRSEYTFKMLEGIGYYFGAAVIMGIIIQIASSLVCMRGIFLSLFQIVLGGITYLIVLLLMKEDNIYRLFVDLKDRH